MTNETRVFYHAPPVGAPTSNPPPYTDNPQPVPPGVYVAPAAVIHTNNVLIARPVGPHPTSTVCRSCHAEIVTRTELKASTKTHLFALGLLLTGLWCFVFVPYCIDSCKNVNHYCPNCSAYIGNYKA